MTTSILNPNFKYTPAVQTDIRKTWERFGFHPKTDMPPPPVLTVPNVARQQHPTRRTQDGT